MSYTSIYKMWVEELLTKDAVKVVRCPRTHKIHCEDGPAIVRANGTVSWVLHDEIVSFEQFCGFQELDDKLKFKLLMSYPPSVHAPSEISVQVDANGVPTYPKF